MDYGTLEKKIVHIKIDKSNYPIIIFESLPTDSTDELLELFLEYQLETCKQASQKVIYIYDISKAKYMPAKHRIRIATWTKENRNILEKKTRSCIVNTSIIIAAMLQCLMLVDKSIERTPVFTKREAALAWAKKEIELL